LVAGADNCSELPEFDEPIGLVSRFQAASGWLSLTPSDIPTFLDSVEPAEHDYVVYAYSTGTTISGSVPERFLLEEGAIDNIRSAQHDIERLIIGVPDNPESALSSPVALYPEGGAASLLPCTFELLTEPLMNAALEQGLAPKDLLTIIAERPQSTLDGLREADASEGAASGGLTLVALDRGKMCSTSPGDALILINPGSGRQPR
jgi:hypothetical protein